MLAPGSPVPQTLLQPVSGLPLTLPEACAQGPVLLCFAGPLRTALARQTLAEVQASFATFDRLGVRVVAVSAADLRLARDYVPRHHLLFPLVVEGASELERAWDVGGEGRSSSFLADLSGETLRRGLRAAKRGGGWRGARPCVAYLLGREGRIVLCQLGASALRGPDLEALLAAAGQLS